MPQHRPKIGLKSSKIAPGSSRKRSNWLPGAFEVRVFGPSGPLVRFLAIFDRFWTISGGVSGSKILPKSKKIGPGRRSICTSFSDLRFDRFGRRFCSQNRLPNRRFLSPESGTALLDQNLQIWRQYYTFGRFLKVRGFGNPSKTVQKSIEKRS